MTGAQLRKCCVALKITQTGNVEQLRKRVQQARKRKLQRMCNRRPYLILVFEIGCSSILGKAKTVKRCFNCENFGKSTNCSLAFVRKSVKCFRFIYTPKTLLHFMRLFDNNYYT